MKKTLIFILILVLLILTFTYILGTSKNKESYDKLSNIETETPYDYTYFDPINENFYYGDVMEFKNSIYYTMISTYEEYQKYKNFYPTIIDMKQEDF